MLDYFSSVIILQLHYGSNFKSLHMYIIYI